MNVLLFLAAVSPLLVGAASYIPVIDSDCSDVYASGYNKSGVYVIFLKNNALLVYCEMVSTGKKNDDGKWTVIHRRMDGDLNFDRPWDQYKMGFGDKSREFWLGLENVHLLTNRHQYELRVDLEDFSGNKAYALYQKFSVSSEANGYRLNIGSFVNGGAGDSLNLHNGMKFTTYDKDQDNSEKNCAVSYPGGWWYNNCYHTNPTGPYLWGKKEGNIGIAWYHWKNSWVSLKSIIMKIRRVKI
ncbi:microfibril-associated glycoprotein 4-like [Myxocyprinus asiaticus]|uniref:microfibril-associated glycoprotein 4-like n=1 Tax=Myxocyprinus asiaticus TaxID=70543 RepID=UPI002222AA65|nr:microfibril-associated glycoprotein 4-like [Myxocyprinus asiaticus]